VLLVSRGRDQGGGRGGGGWGRGQLTGPMRLGREACLCLVPLIFPGTSLVESDCEPSPVPTDLKGLCGVHRSWCFLNAFSLHDDGILTKNEVPVRNALWDKVCHASASANCQGRPKVCGGLLKGLH